MYSEIYNALSGIFMPIKSILSASSLMPMPELTIELSAMLQLYYRYSSFEDMKRYKRVLKTPLFNPNRQSIVIVFDYSGIEEENEYNLAETIITGKFVYEGKITAVTIVPLSIQQNLNNIEYLADEMYKLVGHITMTDNFGYASAPRKTDYTYVPIVQTNIHAPDIIYIKWMMDTFMNVTVTKKELKGVIVKQLRKLGFNYQMKHVELYMDLLEQTDINHLLDYSYIASEKDMVMEIYTCNINDEENSDETVPQN